MKLVELLAKEMIEWPKGFDDVGQADDGSLHLPGIGPHVRHTIEKYTKADDWFESIVTRTQWQAERDRQKGGEWKRHRGGKQPVENRVRVEYKLRCGETGQCASEDLMWDHQKDESDVMQYRVISQPQSEEVEVKDTKIGTLSYKVEIDTTEASQAIDDLAAKWDQVDGPLLWRDTVNELDAYIEEFTRERDALIERLASEGFALIPPVVTAKTDVLPFEEWQVGDVVEVTNVDEFCNEEIKVGDQLPIVMVDKSDDTVSVGIGTWSDTDSYKFIRRP